MSCTKVRVRVLLKWMRHLRELGDDYDPTPGAEWISLLTVGSLDEFEWCWHDGDTLMVFIEPAKLEQKDFSHLKSDAG